MAFRIFQNEPGVLIYVFNSSTWEAEAGGFLWDQPGIHIEFQVSQGYKVRPCLNDTKKISLTQSNREIKIKPRELQDQVVIIYKS